MLMPPDDSPFLAAARIVANGLAASNAHIDSPQLVPLRFFLVESSSQTASLDAVLDAALVSGADIVVGPIERSAVEMLARKKTLPLPVLALNVPDNTDLSAVPQNLGLISISTEYEAEWIAQAAVAALPHFHQQSEQTQNCRYSGFCSLADACPRCLRERTRARTD